MRRAEHDLADAAPLVVDVARRRDEPRVVERVGAAERHLLLRREEELDPRVLPLLVEDPPHRLEHHDDGGLVVRAEDRPGRVADDAVLDDDGLDRRLGRNRVRVRAEEDRRSAPAVRRREPAVDVPGVAVEPRRRVVLVPLEPEVGQVRADAIRDRALAARTGSAARRARGRDRRTAMSSACCTAPHPMTGPTEAAISVRAPWATAGGAKAVLYQVYPRSFADAKR